VAIEIEQLGGEQARSLIALHLLGTTQVQIRALEAEAVRAALWALSRGCATPLTRDSAVPTRTLLHHARRLLLPFVQQSPATSAFGQDWNKGAGSGFVQATEQIDRRLLERLAEQGDLLQLTRGGVRWLPAPPRLVPLGSRYLLAGGQPLHALSAAHQRQIMLRGSLRLLPLGAGGSWPYAYQSLTSWLGPQPPSLRELNTAFQQAQLTPVERAPMESDRIEVYLPHRRGPQEELWQSLIRATTEPPGRYLLRRPERWSRGRFQYSIVFLDQGQILGESLLGEDDDIPRLCYALDQAAGRQTVARWYGKPGSEALELWLESPLPRREYRLLQVVGEREPASQSGRWRYGWRAIARADVPLVEQALQALGIKTLHAS
jgi:hypothetical protein